MTTDSLSYTASLPRKRMGAGCLFFDEQGRVLLVKPTYKPSWEIPGGAVEQDESPGQCCRREVREELGLERATGALLVVDYNRATSEKSEALMFIFDGGRLSAEEIVAIRLPPEELSECRFFDGAELPGEMAEGLRRRVLAALRQAREEGGAYLEEQEPA